jgi:hypothetical protein
MKNPYFLAATACHCVVALAASDYTPASGSGRLRGSAPTERHTLLVLSSSPPTPPTLKANQTCWEYEFEVQGQLNCTESFLRVCPEQISGTCAPTEAMAIASGKTENDPGAFTVWYNGTFLCEWMWQGCW